jgi:glyoxalase/bleomycin resistance protein/dioxygenase superfamily protein
MSAATIDELTLGDEPARWAALGFAIDGERCQLGEVRLRFAGPQAGRGILGWSLRGLAGAELDGLATTLSERPPPPRAPTHPNGVCAIDHIVAFSPDFERSVAALQAAGLELRRIREEPTPAGAPRQAFFRLGEEILELVQQPQEAQARAGGSDGPARFWGLALLSDDLDETVRRLGEHAGETRDAVQPGRRIATVRRSAGLSVALALMSRAEPIVGAR